MLDACASNWKGGHTAVLSYRSSGRALSVQGQGQGPGGADSEWSPSALSPKLVHFPAIRFAKVTCLKSEATASASESSGSHPMLPSPGPSPTRVSFYSAGTPRIQSPASPSTLHSSSGHDNLTCRTPPMYVYSGGRSWGAIREQRRRKVDEILLLYSTSLPFSYSTCQNQSHSSGPCATCH